MCFSYEGKAFSLWYIIGMKKFLKDIAQGVYDGLQENEATHNQYSFQEIYDVIQEFVSYLFVGMILSVGAVFGYPYYKTFIWHYTVRYSYNFFVLSIYRQGIYW